MYCKLLNGAVKGLKGIQTNSDFTTMVDMDVDAIRIPFEEIGIIDIVNHPATVVLPATGGIGIPLYVLCGLTLVLGPLVYGFSLRRRYGRRYKQ